MPQKVICLMRHSEAVTELSDAVTRDFDKPLTDNGIHQLEGVRNTLKSLSFLPDLILCSPSVRTRQTLEWIQEVLGADVEVDFDDTLYGIDVAGLIAKIQQTSETKSSVLVIGHNSSISDAIQQFLNKTTDNNIAQKINLPVKPAQFVMFNMAATSWATILDESVSIEGVFEPA